MIVTGTTDLINESKEIQSFLEITISGDIEESKERATVLSVYCARSGKMLADAKYHLNEKMTCEIMTIIKDQGKQSGVSTTAINRLVNACCRDEQYLVDWIERINRATVHQIDLIRTLISYEKEVMRMAPNQV